MIRISIKVKNDHASYSESFETEPPLTLSHDEPYIKDLIEHCIKEFKQPHDSVIVKTTWEA